MIDIVKNGVLIKTFGVYVWIKQRRQGPSIFMPWCRGRKRAMKRKRIVKFIIIGLAMSVCSGGLRSADAADKNAEDVFEEWSEAENYCIDDLEDVYLEEYTADAKGYEEIEGLPEKVKNRN